MSRRLTSQDDCGVYACFEDVRLQRIRKKKERGYLRFRYMWNPSISSAFVQPSFRSCMASSLVRIALLVHSPFSSW